MVDDGGRHHRCCVVLYQKDFHAVAFQAIFGNSFNRLIRYTLQATCTRFQIRTLLGSTTIIRYCKCGGWKNHRMQHQYYGQCVKDTRGNRSFHQSPGIDLEYSGNSDLSKSPYSAALPPVTTSLVVFKVPLPASFTEPTAPLPSSSAPFKVPLPEASVVSMAPLPAAFTESTVPLP